MTAPARSSHFQVATSQTQHGNGGPSLSYGKFSRRSEVLTYRQHFAETWCGIIRTNFDGPAEVAHTFKVDTSTAEKWWRGTHAPSGWVIGLALTLPQTRDAALVALAGAA